MRHENPGHHLACPSPWEPCRCAELWHAELRPDDDDLAEAYGLFWDPDYDPEAPPLGASYGGWVRAHRESA